MYKVITSNAEVIVCHERLSNQNNKHIVYISRLDKEWLSNHKQASLEKKTFFRRAETNSCFVN